MASRYTGAWARRAQQLPTVPLVQPTDPRHSSPVEEQIIDWRQDTPQPALPDDVLGDQGVQYPATGGPLNLTPWDHEAGGPRGNGLTQDQASEVRGHFHSQDEGAVAEHTFNPQAARDGAYHVDIVDDAQGHGDSPETLQYKQTGVGSPIDPFARTGRRIQRWRDRVIDRHFWEPAMRPSTIRNAYTAPVQQAQANGDQRTSPFGAGEILYVDQFVTPQERVAPRPWDGPMTTDGLAQGGGDYGLTSWGL